MRRLTVLYDPRCGLCLKARAFLLSEPSYVPLELVPAGSEKARRLFPGLDHEATRAELTVVSDSGEVWRDAKAFVICLWALERTRGWSLRLASPENLPMARRFFHWFSEHRHAFSTLLVPGGPA